MYFQLLSDAPFVGPNSFGQYREDKLLFNSLVRMNSHLHLKSAIFKKNQCVPQCPLLLNKNLINPEHKKPAHLQVWARTRWIWVA